VMAFKLAKYSVVAVYCDGGVIGDGGLVRSRSVVGGVWAWCGVNAEGLRVMEAGGSVPAPHGRPVTNVHTEHMAICKALEAMPEGWNGPVYSDNETALGRVFLGWACNNLPSNVKQRTEKALAELGEVYPVLCKGHPRKDMLETGQAWRYEVPCAKEKKPDPRFLGKPGSIWCSTYSNRALDEVTLKMVQARRPIASVFQVSSHQAWCDDECKRQAQRFREVNVF
jgi:ribonuclease HI